MPNFDDADLATAVAGARSWRGVLRAMGYPASSSSAMKAARVQATLLGLDTTHFTGQRRWSDEELARAVENSRSWAEVLTGLGLSMTGGGSSTAIRRHAALLELDTRHLNAAEMPAAGTTPVPHLQHLRRAGPMIASAWYALCGYDVLWPLEPCRYDFAARCYDLLERVQVKTTTYRPSGVAVVSLSNSRRGNRAVYAKAEVDHFFVIDDQLNGYRIPITAVLGRQHVHLRRYERFRVVAEGRLLPPNDRAPG